MSLKQKAIKGVKWTSLSTLIVTVLQLATYAILMRYLEEKDFGQMAIVMVAIGLSNVFLDMGISNAIIQKQDVTRNQLSSLYFLNLFTGLILFLLIFAITPFVATFYNDKQLNELILIVSLTFLIQPLGQQFKILLQKELRFEILAIIEIIVAIVAFVTAIMLSFYDFGVYSLVYSKLCSSIILTLLLFVYGLKLFKPHLYFNRKELKGFLSFGFFQMGERLINYFSTQIDKLIIGKMLNLEQLGIYYLAWQIIIMPLSKINPIVTRIAFPVFSKIQNDVSLLNKYYKKAISLLMAINLPLMAGLGIVAYEFIYLYYGEGHEQIAGLLQILIFVGLIKAFGNPGGSVILAKGRADVGFYWNLVWLSAISLSSYGFIKIFKTLESAAYAQLFATFAFGWIWHVLISKIGGIKYKPIFKALTKLIIMTLIMGAIVYPLTYLPLNIYLKLAIEVIAGILIYSLMFWFWNLSLIKDIKLISE